MAEALTQTDEITWHNLGSTSNAEPADGLTAHVAPISARIDSSDPVDKAFGYSVRYRGVRVAAAWSITWTKTDAQVAAAGVLSEIRALSWWRV